MSKLESSFDISGQMQLMDLKTYDKQKTNQEDHHIINLYSFKRNPVEIMWFRFHVVTVILYRLLIIEFFFLGALRVRES